MHFQLNSKYKIIWFFIFQIILSLIMFSYHAKNHLGTPTSFWVACVLPIALGVFWYTKLLKAFNLNAFIFRILASLILAILADLLGLWASVVLFGG